jgi:hypothetical protein
MNLSYGNSPVTPLVVVPRDKLDEVVVESNSSLGIEDARPKLQKQTCTMRICLRKRKGFYPTYGIICIPAVSNEVSRDQIFLNIAHDSLEVPLGCGPEKSNSIALSVALWKQQITELYHGGPPLIEQGMLQD